MFDEINELNAVEGGTASIEVSGTSTGTQGQVTLTAYSDIITTQRWKPSAKPELQTNKDETFYVNLGFSDNINADK